MRKDYTHNCPNCKQSVELVRVKKKWEVYSEEPYGPHKCVIAKDFKRFLKQTGFYKCRGCGMGVKFVQIDDQKMIISPSGQRHRCDEHLLPVSLRGWSRDGSLPGEYMILNGKPTRMPGRGPAPSDKDRAKLERHLNRYPESRR